jgi:hypothetical protein
VTVSWGVAGHESLLPARRRCPSKLTPLSVGTRVEVVHTDLPEDQVPGHGVGWDHFLPRLARAAAGEHLPADDWRPEL